MRMFLAASAALALAACGGQSTETANTSAAGTDTAMMDNGSMMTNDMAMTNTAGGAGATNQSFPVSAGATDTVLVHAAVRDYRVHVGAATVVDVQLFPCSSVTTGADGTVTFVGTDPGGSSNTCSAA